MLNVTGTDWESHGSPVLNPFDPFVFMPPELAWNMSVVRYVCVGTAGAFVWEILNNMIGNYRLLFHHRIRLPTVVYFISMLSTLAYILGMVVFTTTPVPSCVALKRGLEGIYAAAVSSTSLLFYFRTRAVFDRDRWVVVFFGSMWLAVVGACMTPVIGLGVPPANIGPTRYCMTVEVRSYAAAGIIVPLINDTLIFFAITWRLRCNSSAHHTIKNNLRILIFGDYLPAFSKAMLQDGQAYYLSTITFNLVTVSLLYIHSLPANLRTLFTVPNVALMNIMACKVFRNMKLGLPMQNDISTSILSRDLSLKEEGLSENGMRQHHNTALTVASIAAQRSHDGVMADDKDDIISTPPSMV